MEPSEPSPKPSLKTGKRGLLAVFLLTLTIALAGGIFLGDTVIPPDHETQSVLGTPQDTPATPDGGLSDAVTAQVEEEKKPKLPTELEALRSNLKQGAPTEQQQRSQAVITKADALIEQTDGYIAQAGLTTPQAESAEAIQPDVQQTDDSALQTRIAEARTRLEALKKNRQTN